MHLSTVSVLFAAGWLGAFGGPSTRGEAIERKKIDGWSYSILTDRFTGARRCLVQRGDVILNGGLVTFSLRQGRHRPEVWYRFDQEEARPWKALTVELIRAGYSPYKPDRRRPNRTEVVFPAERLAGVSEVSIRPAAQASARRFKIAGLWRAVEASRSLGCDPTSR